MDFFLTAIICQFNAQTAFMPIQEQYYRKLHIIQQPWMNHIFVECTRHHPIWFLMTWYRVTSRKTCFIFLSKLYEISHENVVSLDPLFSECTRCFSTYFTLFIHWIQVYFSTFVYRKGYVIFRIHRIIYQTKTKTKFSKSSGLC